MANSSKVMPFNLTIASPNDTISAELYKELDAEFQRFLSLKDWGEYPMLVVTCILGIVGSVLTLGTFGFNEKFAEPSFLCYQAIAIYEILIALGFGFNAFYKLCTSMKIYFSWHWTEEIAVRFGLDPFRESVSVLTMYLSIGRVVAVFLPTHYHLIDRRAVSFAVIFMSLIFFIAVDLPHIAATRVVWNPTTNMYAMSSSGPNVDASTEIKNALWITLAVFLLISTVLAVTAYVKGMVLRKRLFQNTPIQSFNSEGPSPFDAVKKNLQLCYLQLCLTLPLIFYNGLFFVLKWWKDDEIAAEKRKGNFSWAYQQAWLLLLLYVSESLAHFFHFYLYLVFCKSFRDAFRERFLRK